MNWSRTILDAFAMAAYFNLFAIVIVVINPRIMMYSYPKSIQKAAPMPQTRRERKLYHLWMYFGMLLPLAIYGSISAVSGGVSGFWPLFWMGYIEWLVVSFADFFLLDIYLLQKLGRRIQVPGTEGHPDYYLGNWLKKLALPEHFLAWPLVMAPLVSLVQACLGMLWGYSIY